MTTTAAPVAAGVLEPMTSSVATADPSSSFSSSSSSSNSSSCSSLSLSNGPAISTTTAAAAASTASSNSENNQQQRASRRSSSTAAQAKRNQSQSSSPQPQTTQAQSSSNTNNDKPVEQQAIKSSTRQAVAAAKSGRANNDLAPAHSEEQRPTDNRNQSVQLGGTQQQQQQMVQQQQQQYHQINSTGEATNEVAATPTANSTLASTGTKLRSRSQQHQNQQQQQPQTQQQQQQPAGPQQPVRGRRGRKRQQAVQEHSNGLDRVFVWDIDGSLMRSDIIITDDSLEQHSVLASVNDKLSALSKQLTQMTFRFCDENLFLNELELSEQMHIDDVQQQQQQQQQQPGPDQNNNGTGAEPTFAKNQRGEPVAGEGKSQVIAAGRPISPIAYAPPPTELHEQAPGGAPSNELVTVGGDAQDQEAQMDMMSSAHHHQFHQLTSVTALVPAEALLEAQPLATADPALWAHHGHNHQHIAAASHPQHPVTIHHSQTDHIQMGHHHHQHHHNQQQQDPQQIHMISNHHYPQHNNNDLQPQHQQQQQSSHQHHQQQHFANSHHQHHHNPYHQHPNHLSFHQAHHIHAHHQAVAQQQMSQEFHANHQEQTDAHHHHHHHQEQPPESYNQHTSTIMDNHHQQRQVMATSPDRQQPPAEQSLMHHNHQMQQRGRPVADEGKSPEVTAARPTSSIVYAPPPIELHEQASNELVMVGGEAQDQEAQMDMMSSAHHHQFHQLTSVTALVPAEALLEAQPLAAAAATDSALWAHHGHNHQHMTAASHPQHPVTIHHSQADHMQAQGHHNHHHQQQDPQQIHMMNNHHYSQYNNNDLQHQQQQQQQQSSHQQQQHFTNSHHLAPLETAPHHFSHAILHQHQHHHIPYHQHPNHLSFHPAHHIHAHHQASQEFLANHQEQTDAHHQHHQELSSETYNHNTLTMMDNQQHQHHHQQQQVMATSPDRQHLTTEQSLMHHNHHSQQPQQHQQHPSDMFAYNNNNGGQHHQLQEQQHHLMQVEQTEPSSVVKVNQSVTRAGANSKHQHTKSSREELIKAIASNPSANTATLRNVLNSHHKQVSQKLSMRFHRIKTVYNQYRGDIPKIELKSENLNHPIPVAIHDILDEIDHFTLDWRKHSIDCLKLISESQNCTNIIITRMPLIIALGHLVCLGFSSYFDIDQIYSASKTSKEICIKRIKKRFGAANRCSYIIVGDNNDAEMARKLDLPHWLTSRSDGHTQLQQLLTALKEGYLM